MEVDANRRLIADCGAVEANLSGDEVPPWVCDVVETYDPTHHQHRVAA